MSPVVGNIGSTGASVAVTKGYSVANSAYVGDPRPSPQNYYALDALCQHQAIGKQYHLAVLPGEITRRRYARQRNLDLDDQRRPDFHVSGPPRPVRARRQQPIRPSGHGKLHLGLRGLPELRAMADNHVLNTRVHQYAVGNGAYSTLQQHGLSNSVLRWIGDTRLDTANQETNIISNPLSITP